MTTPLHPPSPPHKPHSHIMQHIYKLMTLNINGIASDTKFRMLEELIKRQEIDIVLLQE
jgi:hypothetical protein